MIELTINEFAGVLTLLAGIEQQVLPYAICEGNNPGRVFADQRENPHTALIWSPVGYYFLAGEPAPERGLTDISQVLTEIFIPASQAAGETGFILIPSGKVWKAHIPALLPYRRVKEVYRRPFAFDPARFAAQGNWRERIPQNFNLYLVDMAIAEQINVLASWASIEDFLANGMGFALLKGDEIASTCISIFSSRERMEIDVHTAEKYRRRGLAVLVASAFVEACQQRGKQPNWECFWDNKSSSALATRLGFTALPDYPVYYWEE